MMDHMHPWLSGSQLGEFRTRLKAIRTQGGPVSLSPVALALASETGPALGLTIDFSAERELGHPLVVVRVKEEPRPAWFSVLSSREREVALRLTRGDANKEIARALHISTATVKDHVHNSLQKSGCSGRTHVALALNRTVLPATAAIHPLGGSRL